MFRLFFFFALLPTFAAADWSPRPSMFSYDATFDQCTQDPSRADLVATCTDLLAAAFVVKRSVARATQACLDDDLANCAIPFEDEGLPAIAARIAAGTGCENTDLSEIQEFEPLPDLHCAPLIADILIDEGVVPVDTSVSCITEGDDCVGLAITQDTLWGRAVLGLENGPLNNPVANDLIQRIADECVDDPTAPNPPSSAPVAANRFHCTADGMARLWRDLVQEN